MASGRAGISRQIEALFGVGTASVLTDAELLERFATRRDAAAEAAFAALVERHGPVVLRVCRDVLRDPYDAEDAFQATFLVLVRRAGSIRNGDSVASWLYGVALRVASCTWSSAIRRRGHEQKAAEAATSLNGDGGRDDLAPVLHEEVGRLPEKYRVAVVLCYWQGLTHEQAAERLRWPVGTVRSRLSWARRRLGSRLIRRGLAPAVVVPIVAPSATAGAASPSMTNALVECTVQAARQFAAGRVPAAGLVSEAAWTLTEGMIKTMMLAKLKIAGCVVLTVGIVTAGAGGLALQERESNEPKRSERGDGEPPRVVPPPRESGLETQIRKLEVYRRELQAKVDEQKGEWLDLAKKNIDLVEPMLIPGDLNLPMARPSQISLAEYKRIREQQFQVSMDLIESDALLNARQAEDNARPADLRQMRIEDAYRNDPQVASLLPQIALARGRMNELARSTNIEGDPSRVQAERRLRNLEDRLWQILDRKHRELALQFHEPHPESPAPALDELRTQVKAMKVRKGSYEKILSRIKEEIQRGENDTAKLARIREELVGLQVMLEAVAKRIEQLQYDARTSRPR